MVDLTKTTSNNKIVPILLKFITKLALVYVYMKKLDLFDKAVNSNIAK